MPTGYAQTFGVLNYSGMLFNKGNTKVPFSTLIANKSRITNSMRFSTGIEYQTEGGTQPNITESGSLIAPLPTYITRTQAKNVTQIFHETVGVSYAKESNMGHLSGLNIGGVTANPPTELDFQIAAKMNKIARDIEATFINGAYVEAADDVTANRSRGMLTAITTNELQLGNKGLRIWDVAEAMKMIYDRQGSTNGLVLWVDPVSLFQLNADAEANGLTIVPASREINGLSISTLLTPLGEIGVYLGEFLPAGTAAIFNPSVISRVEQPVPGKGNFFLEELAQVGAGKRYQIFGQLGLDHGPEWMHAKITGINQNFVKPEPGIKVYTGTEPLAVAEVLPVISGVLLETPVYNSATEALGITYKGTPITSVSLTYQWEKADHQSGPFSEIAGQTSATYTPGATDVDKFIRCVVTASGGAVGSKTSNAKKVKAIEVAVTSVIENDAKSDIVCTLDPAVAGLAVGDFVVTKDGNPASLTSATASNANATYTVVLDVAAAAGEVFTITITKAGYAFIGTAVNNKAEA